MLSRSPPRKCALINYRRGGKASRRAAFSPRDYAATVMRISKGTGTGTGTGEGGDFYRVTRRGTSLARICAAARLFLIQRKTLPRRKSRLRFMRASSIAPADAGLKFVLKTVLPSPYTSAMDARHCVDRIPETPDRTRPVCRASDQFARSGIYARHFTPTCTHILGKRKRERERERERKEKKKKKKRRRR